MLSRGTHRRIAWQWIFCGVRGEIFTKNLKKTLKNANETTFVTSAVYAAAEQGNAQDLSVFDGVEKTFPN